MATTKHRTNKPEGSISPGAAEPAAGHDGPGFPIVGIGASAGGLAAF